MREIEGSIDNFGGIPIGTNVIVRGNFTYTGKLVAVTPTLLVLTDAAWIGNSGRWANALSSGQLEEVEPYRKGKLVVIERPIYDCTPWDHSLPRTVV